MNLAQVPDSTITPIPQTIKDTTSLINNTDTSKVIKPKKDSITVIKKSDSIKSASKDTSALIKKIDSVKLTFKDSISIKNNISEYAEIKIDTIFFSKNNELQELSYKPEIIVTNYDYSTGNDSINYSFQKTFLLYDNENISLKKNTIAKIITNKTDSSKAYQSEIKTIKSINTANYIKSKNADWFLAILIVVLSITTILRILYSRYFSDSIKSLWSYQHAIKLFKENNVVNQRLSFISNILFILSFSLFVVLCNDFFANSGFSKNNFLLFILISVSIVSIYLIKYAVYKILGYIFLDSASYSEYLYNVFQFNRIAGIFLIPIIIALAYSTIYYTNAIVYSGFVILFIVFIMRIIRGLQICSKVNFSIFYSFLYLCVLEILPLLVIYKLIIINI